MQAIQTTKLCRDILAKDFNSFQIRKRSDLHIVDDVATVIVRRDNEDGSDQVEPGLFLPTPQFQKLPH
jgi:hypothetical protein